VNARARARARVCVCVCVCEREREREGGKRKRKMIVRYVNMYIEYTLFIAAPRVRYSSPHKREGKNQE